MVFQFTSNIAIECPFTQDHSRLRIDVNNSLEDWRITICAPLVRPMCYFCVRVSPCLLSVKLMLAPDEWSRRSALELGESMPTLDLSPPGIIMTSVFGKPAFLGKFPNSCAKPGYICNLELGRDDGNLSTEDAFNANASNHVLAYVGDGSATI